MCLFDCLLKKPSPRGNINNLLIKALPLQICGNVLIFINYESFVNGLRGKHKDNGIGN